MDSDLDTMEPDGLWERYLEEPFKKFAPKLVRGTAHAEPADHQDRRPRARRDVQARAHRGREHEPATAGVRAIAALPGAAPISKHSSGQTHFVDTAVFENRRASGSSHVKRIGIPRELPPGRLARRVRNTSRALSWYEKSGTVGGFFAGCSISPVNTSALPISPGKAPRVLSSFLVGLMLFCAGEAVSAPKDGKRPQVGVLLVGSPDYPTLKGFLRGLTDAGYVVGETLVLDMGIKSSYDELGPVATAYNDKKLDVVVTFGETTTAMAVKVIRATPIVFIHAIDPVGMGFVKSLAHPGT